MDTQNIPQDIMDCVTIGSGYGFGSILRSCADDSLPCLLLPTCSVVYIEAKKLTWSGGEQRLLFLHKARRGRAYVSDQRDGLLYVKRVTFEDLVQRDAGQVFSTSKTEKD